MESPDSRDSADAAQTPDDTAANTTAMDDSAPPRRQIAVAPLIFGATILAVLVRGMTSVMTRVIAWPLFGTLVTFLYQTPVFRYGAALEILLSIVLIFVGLLSGFRARRDPAGRYQQILRLGWFLVIDVILYLASIVAAVALFARGGVNPQLWGLGVYILLGNIALLWLGLRIIGVGRSLKPPPAEKD